MPAGSLAPDGVDLVAEPPPGGGDPLAQHLDPLLVCRVAVAGGSDLACAPCEEHHERSTDGGGEEESDQPAHGASVLPRVSGSRLSTACAPQAAPVQRGPRLDRGQLLTAGEIRR